MTDEDIRQESQKLLFMSILLYALSIVTGIMIVLTIAYLAIFGYVTIVSNDSNMSVFELITALVVLVFLEYTFATKAHRFKCNYDQILEDINNKV